MSDMEIPAKVGDWAAFHPSKSSNACLLGTVAEVDAEGWVLSVELNGIKHDVIRGEVAVGPRELASNPAAIDALIGKKFASVAVLFAKMQPLSKGPKEGSRVRCARFAELASTPNAHARNGGGNG